MTCSFRWLPTVSRFWAFGCDKRWRRAEIPILFQDVSSIYHNDLVFFKNESRWYSPASSYFKEFQTFNIGSQSCRMLTFSDKQWPPSRQTTCFLAAPSGQWAASNIYWTIPQQTAATTKRIQMCHTTPRVIFSLTAKMQKMKPFLILLQTSFIVKLKIPARTDSCC